MIETKIIVSKKVKLKNAVLIEGLPGIGLVGKIAAEHLIEELKAEKFAELYSPHFPHQVLMLKNGTIRMLKNQFYYWKNPKKEGKDLVILVGDVQAVTSEAQYEVSMKILEFFKGLGGKTVYTLGGYGVGKAIQKPRVFCSVTHKELVPELKKHGLVFGEASGSIIGAAGLLLGLGMQMELNGACLMGETHGGYVDANSAKAVLEKLAEILEISVDMEKLNERAKESEEFMKRLEEETQQQVEAMGGAAPKGELSYIR